MHEGRPTSVSPMAFQRGFHRAIDQPSLPADARHVAGSVKSTDLLKGQRAVDIDHNGAIYRLQTTKLGKLILTK